MRLINVNERLIKHKWTPNVYQRYVFVEIVKEMKAVESVFQVKKQSTIRCSFFNQMSRSEMSISLSNLCQWIVNPRRSMPLNHVICRLAN